VSRDLGRLTQEWESRLAAEGLAPIRPLSQSSNADPSHADGLVVVSNPADALTAEWAIEVQVATFGESTTLTNTATATYWRRFSSAVHQLPKREYSARARSFLLSYAEHGNRLRACRATGLSRQQGERVLARFRKHLSNLPHNDNGR